MMVVMSSVRDSCCSHRRYDSATIAIAASCGSSYLLTMSTTLWLDKNSHTPSLAMTRNGLRADRRLTRTSGSANTPIASAVASPIDRVNAVPGYLP